MTMFRTRRALQALRTAVSLAMLGLVGAPGLVSAVEVGGISAAADGPGNRVRLSSPLARRSQAFS
jgi:hypothetical protein